MADFLTSYKIIAENEGGYASTPGDKGLETYGGVSRKYWPNWQGWKLIDQYKETRGVYGINKTMAENPFMQQYLHDFYKQNFWNPLQLDLMRDQQLASNVADFAVNAGVGISAKKLQLAAGVPVDGQVGSITISAVNNGIAEDIYDKFNMLRKAYYMAIIERDPSQEQFKVSWMSRIKPYIKATN